MEYIDFGSTGLKVSVAGLGCGGHSRLGQKQGKTVEQSADVIRAALDLGINLIDTAAAYRTEHIVGQALKKDRERAIISTKALIVKDGQRVSAAGIRASLENSLRALETDYVDILHLHAVAALDYAYCHQELLPELVRMREEGKIRFLGLTEKFIQDTRHDMLEIALKDDDWDAVMVGFSMLNPSARHKVFPITQKKSIGTLCMFAVRRALSNKQALRELVEELIGSGHLDPAKIDRANPLEFLTKSDAPSLINAAYRFCRHEPGCDVVLTGTGSVEHLKENVNSILAPRLSNSSLERLASQFGRIDSISGN